MSLAELLEQWKRDKESGPNFSAWQSKPAQEARTQPIPAEIPKPLKEALAKKGIQSLYSHQVETWFRSRAGKHIVLSTGTASGKTLAYNLPVMAGLLENPTSRALYLFPTKALAQDQISVIKDLLSATIGQLTRATGINPDQGLEMNTAPLPIVAAIYDGDTPQKDRPAIRKQARILLSNPDMLHTGILPHHANWNEFFSGLKLVIIDEMHIYRGVFGSHVANVLRRLTRVADFYGSKPQFILASATIGNPRQLAEQLIGAPVTLIDQDGSGRGERHFLIYNPPITDPALGLRKSSLLESVRLARDLITANLQSVIFARTRRTVEILLTYLKDSTSSSTSQPKGQGEAKNGRFRGYRSGYLPRERREIEAGLRSGDVRAVVATNALELGIDIGGLGAALLVGYPGTIASARQQAGRAGRGNQPAVAVLVVSSNPLDQYLAHHPEYFFDISPEQAYINPDHLLILLEHLRCAIFELPFRNGEGFGNMDGNKLGEFLDFLIQNKEAYFSNQTYYWMADQYPAAQISLRATSPLTITLQAINERGRPEAIGTVDGESATWMVHPGAVYIHEGQQYFVQDLNLEIHVAQLIPVGLDYYTEAQRRSEITILSVLSHQEIPGGEKAHGEIKVTTRVVGFKKLRWLSNENLGEEPLDMPPSELQTTGYWLALAGNTINILRERGAWTNDPNDYGPAWSELREWVRARDQYRCQICGATETTRQHDVHHKTPFRAFMRTGSSPELAMIEANRMENLTTLCHSCHNNVEQNVRIRSGLAGLGFVLSNLAPLFLMCDPSDLGIETDPAGSVFGNPAVVIYDQIPAGIGLSQNLFEIHTELISRALEVVSQCGCKDGCPSCVGPGGENGLGGKQETLALLNMLAK